MVTPFGIAVVLLGVVGTTGVLWVLWPAIRPAPPPADDEADHELPISDDALARLRLLEDLFEADEDGPVPWTRRAPLLPEQPLTAPFRPSDAILAVVDDARIYLLPLQLIERSETDAPPPAVLRGRVLGRAFHAVHLQGEVYLDLIAGARVLPIVGAELAGQTDVRSLSLFRDVEHLLAETGTDSVVALAPWLEEDWHQRILPEGDGARSFVFSLLGNPLEVEAWMPAVRVGVERGEPVCAGRIRFGNHAESAIVDEAALEGLGGEWASESWYWSREALLELASVGMRLSEEGIDVFPFVREAFLDRQIPEAVDDQDRLVVAGVLNWAGVVVRKAGLPQRALGFFDAGLEVCGEGQEDNRADLHYNRGYARLHAACAYLDPTEHERIQVFTFADDVPPELLEAALRDFTIASGLSPNDPDAWSQIALIEQLRGRRAQASEAWLQAATRVRDEAVRQALLANAEAQVPTS